MAGSFSPKSYGEVLENIGNYVQDHFSKVKRAILPNWTHGASSLHPKISLELAAKQIQDDINGKKTISWSPTLFSADSAKKHKQEKPEIAETETKKPPKPPT